MGLCIVGIVVCFGEVFVFVVVDVGVELLGYVLGVYGVVGVLC